MYLVLGVNVLTSFHENLSLPLLPPPHLSERQCGTEGFAQSLVNATSHGPLAFPSPHDVSKCTKSSGMKIPLV
jgi:hypothetical protein